MAVSAAGTVRRRGEQLEHGGQWLDEVRLRAAAVGARHLAAVLREEREPVLRGHHQAAAIVALRNWQKLNEIKLS